MEQNTKTIAEHIAEYIAIVRRRKYYIIAIFIFTTTIAVIVAYNLPRTYRSSATMLMEAPMPKSLIQSTLTEYAGEQITSITQRVMTTDNILKIIETNNLYNIPDDDPEKYILVDQFKHDTEIRLLKSDLVGREEASGLTDIAFSISFLYTDANTAKDIATTLANLFIEQNDRARTQRALRAAGFLADESDKLSKDIQNIDSRISDYKKQYEDSLPENMQGNISALDRNENELRDTEHQIRTAKERITFLGAELARAQTELPSNSDNKTPLTRDEELKILQAQYLKLSGRYNPSHPDVVRVKRQIEALAPLSQENFPVEDIRKQLAEAKHNLRLFEEKAYADNHPDIARLKNQIGVLEQQLKNSQPSSHQEGIPVRSTNPAYLSIEAQYQSSQVELESLIQRRDALKSKLEALQNRISAAPEVERGYLELIRERDHALNKYNQLKDKLLDAKLVQTLEAEQHGQTLTIIEQPTVPTRPEKAIRRKVAIGGFFLGIALGLGCALLLEFLDPRVRGYRAIAEATGFMPLVVIPYIESPSETEKKLVRQRQIRSVMIRAGTACIVLTIVVICFIFLQWLAFRSYPL